MLGCPCFVCIQLWKQNHLWNPCSALATLLEHSCNTLITLLYHSCDTLSATDGNESGGQNTAKSAGKPYVMLCYVMLCRDNTSWHTQHYTTLQTWSRFYTHLTLTLLQTGFMSFMKDSASSPKHHKTTITSPTSRAEIKHHNTIRRLGLWALWRIARHHPNTIKPP
jgi:hypothetical protein